MKTELSMQQRVDRVLSNRMTYLLTKHADPAALRAWKRRVQETVSVPAKFSQRPDGFLLCLMEISAAANTIFDVHPDYNAYATDTENRRLRQKAERNERLLRRLLYLGAVRRGELRPAVTVTLRPRKSRLRRVAVRQDDIFCPPIPIGILNNGKNNGLMWINGEFVHVCESDENGCTVHRPDLMPRSYV